MLFKHKKQYNDEYDELFGVPKIEVWNTIDLLDFSDAVTAYTTGESFNKRKYLKQKSFAVVEGLNNKYSLKIKTVIVGKSFEESVKLSSQKQRPDIIREIKKAIIELAAVECEEGTRYRELTLKEGKCRLLYRYIGDAKLIAEINKDELCALLDMNNAPGPEPADAITIINPLFCKKQKLQVEVHQGNEGPVPHMHVYHDETRNPAKCSCVRLDKCEYAPGHEFTKMPRRIKKKFIKLMNAPTNYGMKGKDGKIKPANGYQAAVQIWADTFEEDLSKFNTDDNGYIIPVDYSKL